MVQETFDDQRCAGSGEPALDFWYVPGDLTWPLLASGRTIVLSAKNLKDISGIYSSKKPEEQRKGSSRNSGM